MNDHTDRGWWLPIAVFAVWLGAVAVATVEIGVWAGVLAWLGVPLVLGGGLMGAAVLEDRRVRRAMRRHPSSLGPRGISRG